MSFSFRNIFSPDENSFEGVPTGFDQPGFSTSEGTGRSGLAPAGESPEVSGQSFLISELIAFIPPAISAQSGIPMTREVRIPLPADGSRDVKLSTIYQLCPELFAVEITPLNESTVTLPPKLGAMGAGASAGATGFSPPSSEKLPTSFPVSPAAAGNPFWSPTPPKAEEITAMATPSDMKDEQPRTRQEETSVWPKEPAAGMNPFAASGSAVPAKGNAFGAPAAAPERDDSGFSGGISGFESQPLSSLFGTGSAGSMTNEADDKGGKPFAGNPFESEQGFNSLFSKQAEADKHIPFPTDSVAETPAATADEPRGVWGAMFHGGGFGAADEVVAEVDADAPFSPPAFESIGNLLKQGTEAAAGPAPTGFQKAPEPGGLPAAPPAFAPMTSTSAIPTGFSAFEAVPELVEIAPAPVPAPALAPKEEAPRATTPPPATGFPAFVAPPRAFAGFGEGAVDTVPNPSPIDVFANAAFEAPVEAPAPALAPIPEPAPAREVVEAAPAPARSASPAPTEIGSDLRDLELRAIFSTGESFTLSIVARRVVGLPGIISCSLSTPGKLVQASKSDEGRIGNEAREMVTTLRSLAKLTGLPEARTFTLHTDRGIVSLFLEGECCVMVHHEAAAFEPGVREKLILVARSLINLKE